MDDSNGRLRSSPISRLRKHFAQDVTQSWGDSVLLILCFVTGLVDGAVFNNWSCFVSMQTGNTLYAGLGVSGQPLSEPWRWVKALTSILSFMLGAFVFHRVVHALSPLRRSTVCGCFIVQASLCWASAALVQSGVVPEDAGTILPDSFIVLLPIVLLSFQAAGQVLMSRVLEFTEVPTVVLTMSYSDLMFDTQLFSAPLREGSKRNRRVLAVVGALTGAIVGGFLTKTDTVANPLWIAGAIKMGIAIGWVFWKAEGSIQLE